MIVIEWEKIKFKIVIYLFGQNQCKTQRSLTSKLQQSWGKKKKNESEWNKKTRFNLPAASSFSGVNVYRWLLKFGDSGDAVKPATATAAAAFW